MTSTILFLKARDRRDTGTADMFAAPPAATHVETHTRKDGVVQKYHVAAPAAPVPPKLDLPTIEHDGDTWHVLGTGATNEDGKVYHHLSSTTRGRHQKNGINPVQMADWIDPPKPAAPVLHERLPGWKHAILTEPRKLFRSVSPDELKHILETGAVRGGGNRFNGFDPRREVFFSDKFNQQTIGQGEDVSRRAENAIKDHPLEAEFQAANMELRTMQDLHRAKYGSFTPPAERKKREKIQARIDKLRADGKAVLQAHMKAERAKGAAQGWTSAVIETHPLAGARHYSKQWGQSGMGEDDEFGFDSNDVQADNIVAIHLMKDGKQVRTIKPGDPLEYGAPLAKSLFLVRRP